MAESPADMAPEHLRVLLVGALKHGSTMTVCFGALGGGGWEDHSFTTARERARARHIPLSLTLTHSNVLTNPWFGSLSFSIALLHPLMTLMP